jgi:hypothetical protein
MNKWNYLKMLLAMVLPVLTMIGSQWRNEDQNDTGIDDLKGYTALYIVDLITALESGDANKIQHELNKVAPK